MNDRTRMAGALLDAMPAEVVDTDREWVELQPRLRKARTAYVARNVVVAAIAVVVVAMAVSFLSLPGREVDPADERGLDAPPLDLADISWSVEQPGLNREATFGLVDASRDGRLPSFAVMSEGEMLVSSDGVEWVTRPAPPLEEPLRLIPLDGLRTLAIRECCTAEAWIDDGGWRQVLEGQPLAAEGITLHESIDVLGLAGDTVVAQVHFFSAGWDGFWSDDTTWLDMTGVDPSEQDVELVYDSDIRTMTVTSEGVEVATFHFDDRGDGTGFDVVRDGGVVRSVVFDASLGLSLDMWDGTGFITEPKLMIMRPGGRLEAASYPAALNQDWGDIRFLAADDRLFLFLQPNVEFDEAIDDEPFMPPPWQLWSTTDGATWELIADELPIDGFDAGAVHGSTFVLMSDVEDTEAGAATYCCRPVVWTSDDGVDWTRHDLADAGPGEQIFRLFAVDGGFVGMGEWDCGGDDCSRLSMWLSADGATWQRIVLDTIPIDGVSNSDLANSSLVASGRSVLISMRDGRVIVGRW